MQYRRMGNTGLRLSALSLGSWVTFKNQVDQKKAIEMMQMAYEAGVNFFDNAEVYAAGEAEEIMGRALNELQWARETYTVSSKVFWGGPLPTQRGLNRKHVFDACHAALRRLQVDYLDLFYCHRPDLHTPISETVEAMTDLIRQGKVMYWGTSEWSAQQITEAHQVASERHLVGPSVEQPQYNMFEREKVEKEFLPVYRSFGLGTTVWSPLASGLLTGKYQNGIPEGSRLSLESLGWLREQLASDAGKQKLQKVDGLLNVAKRLDTPVAGLAIAWCLKCPHVTSVILGASNPEQLKNNLSALSVVERLDVGVMEEIEGILGNRPSPEIDFLD